LGVFPEAQHALKGMPSQMQWEQVSARGSAAVPLSTAGPLDSSNDLERFQNSGESLEPPELNAILVPGSSTVGTL
jgi:hypothetical protein